VHLTTRNVGTALIDFVKLFKYNGELDYVTGENQTVPIVKETSRNGNVLRIGEPVTITYTKSLQRVLFNHVRDANPFALLYEALWMIAGRNDVASLAYYTKRFTEFSDDGKTLNGAYGYRWRNNIEVVSMEDYPNGHRVDQLDVLVTHLKANPTSRRAVLTMWEVENDLLKIDSSKDVVCNTEVMFSLRCVGWGKREATETNNLQFRTYEPTEPEYVLDMTVVNRSNDMLWGALGANFVTFSVLLEYMAARIGVLPGLYHHFSNNFHVYVDRPDWKPNEILECDETDGDTYYAAGSEWPTFVPLVKNPEVFEEELPRFVERHKKCSLVSVDSEWQEPFLNDVAQPLLNAFHCHKDKTDSDFYENAMEWVEEIKSPDWQLAARNWINRRKHRREAKNETSNS
jgi:thymidylate synthase